MDSLKAPIATRRRQSVQLTELQKYWNGFAEIYTNYHSRATVAVQQCILVNLQLSSAQRVLQVGAGPGNSTRVIIREMDADCPLNQPRACELVASDYAPEMVERLRLAVDRAAAERQCNGQLPSSLNIVVKEIDSRKLPYADGTFDRYFAGLSIHFLPEYRTCIREAARVLSKGGVAGFSVWGREENCTLFSIPQQIMDDCLIESGMPPTAKTVQANQNNENAPHHSNYECGSNPERLVGVLKQAGFSRVIYWYTQLCAFSGFDKGSLPVALKTTYVSDLFDQQPEAIRDELMAKVEQRLLERLDDGMDNTHKPLMFEALCVVAIK